MPDGGCARQRCVRGLAMARVAAYIINSHVVQVGLCMAHNRLCGFRVVRSTRPVHFIPPEFVPPRDQRTVAGRICRLSHSAHNIGHAAARSVYARMLCHLEPT